MKYIFKYLRKTKNLFLIFEGDSDLRVGGYKDADDRMSILGCILIRYIGRVLINRSMEADYTVDV